MAICLLIFYCIVVANAVYWDHSSYAGNYKFGGFGKNVVSRDTLNSPDDKSIIDELTENVDELYVLLQQGIAVSVFESKVQSLQDKAKNYLDNNGIIVPDADIVEALLDVSESVNDTGIVAAIFEGPVAYESRRTINSMLMLRGLMEKAAEEKDGDYNRYIAAVEKIAGVLPSTVQHAVDLITLQQLDKRVSNSKRQGNWNLGANYDIAKGTLGGSLGYTNKNFNAGAQVTWSPTGGFGGGIGLSYKFR